jgi:hypothetical protein
MSSRARSALLLAGILAPLASLSGCSGIVSGQNIQPPPPFITLLTYTGTTALAGQTYYYVATSMNASNVESSYSNEISATIPTP